MPLFMFHKTKEHLFLIPNFLYFSAIFILALISSSFYLLFIRFLNASKRHSRVKWLAERFAQATLATQVGSFYQIFDSDQQPRELQCEFFSLNQCLHWLSIDEMEFTGPTYNWRGTGANICLCLHFLWRENFDN